VAIAEDNQDEHNRTAAWRFRLATWLIGIICGGWRPHTEIPPKGKAWASDGKSVWWIWTDGDGIPESATRVLFWMPYPMPDPPPPASSVGERDE
jgi:hypothetical protein